MKKLFIPLLLAIITLASCKKEVMEANQLEGSWKEKTSNQFKHGLIFKSDSLFILREARTDTFLFFIDEETSFLNRRSLGSSSESYSSSKIEISYSDNKINTYDLVNYQTYPEPAEKVVFKRE